MEPLRTRDGMGIAAVSAKFSTVSAKVLVAWADAPSAGVKTTSYSGASPSRPCDEMRLART